LHENLGQGPQQSSESSGAGERSLREEVARKELVRLKVEVARSQAESAHLRREVNRLQGQLDEMRNSTIWQITGPLRRGITAARALRARLRRARMPRGFSPWRRKAGEAVSAGGTPLLSFEGEEQLPDHLRDAQLAADTAASVANHSRRRALETMSRKPVISLMMPTFNSALGLVRQAVESVVAQTYDTWELCVVDDGSTADGLRSLLEEFAERDERIRLRFLPENRGIAATINEALEMTSGEYVGVVDHDDELLPEALQEVALLLDDVESVDAVYTDESYIEEEGEPSDLLLKPDWSPTFFRGVMYIGHLLVVRRELAVGVGGFDSAYDNVQDFEFMLRLSEQTNRIHHVPRVLYHWRRASTSIASRNPDAKRDVDLLQATAVNAHLERMRIPAYAEPHGIHSQRLRLRPTLEKGPKVGVVVEDFGEAGALETTIASLTADHERTLGDTIVCRREAASRLAALRSVPEDYVLYIQAGYALEPTEGLAALLLHAILPRVGAVSPLVLDASGRVEDAGMIVGLGQIVRAHQGGDPDSDGFAGSLSCAREVSAVSGACVLVSRSALRRAGVSEFFQTPSYGWADVCFRLRRHAFCNIVTPEARVRCTSTEGRSSGEDFLDELLLADVWTDLLKGADPFHNPNFDGAGGGYHVRDQDLAGVSA